MKRPAFVHTNARQLCRLVFCGLLVPIALPSLACSEEASNESHLRFAADTLPGPVEEDAFTPVRTHSPFSRSIEFFDGIVLTGVARIEGTVLATLFDTETAETHLLTDQPNAHGWKLMAVQGDQSDLESLTATIQVSGGEIVSIRYEELSQSTLRRRPGSNSPASSGKLSDAQQTEAKRAAIRYKEGFSSDGYPREPPREIVEKLSKLRVEQREAINKRMIELRNRGLGREERRKIYDDMVDRSLRGR